MILRRLISEQFLVQTRSVVLSSEPRHKVHASHHGIMPTFTSMAEKLLIQAKQLDKQLSRCGCHQTSFDNDTMEILSPEAELIRNSLVDSAQDIKRLAQGTRGAYAEILFTVSNSICRTTSPRTIQQDASLLTTFLPGSTQMNLYFAPSTSSDSPTSCRSMVRPHSNRSPPNPAFA